jgi:hypothetical protein
VSALLVAGVVGIAPSAEAQEQAPSSAGSSFAASPETPGADSCTPIQPVQTRFIGADGETVSPSDTARLQEQQVATELTYDLSDGAKMSTIVPPVGFLPQNATPETARAFGFDVPDSPAALASWQANYQDYKETVPSVPCIGTQPLSSPMQPASSDAPLAPSAVTSSNWGGFTAHGHSNYVEVYDDQNIPTYDTTCGGEGLSLGSWIGLGGSNSPKLIQQGFASGQTAGAVNGARVWYEYLNAAHPNPPVYIGSTSRTGDVISEAMTYNAGRVTFHWYDRTIGSGWSDVTVSGLSSYYDGTTADFITEMPGEYKLRKFTPYQGFDGSGAKYGSTFANLFALPTTEVRLVNAAGTALMSSARQGSSATAFTQKWLRCS